MTPKQADAVIQTVDNLIDNKQYKPFFYKCLYKLQPTLFLVIAEECWKADVEYKGRLFASKLKEAMKERQ